MEKIVVYAGTRNVYPQMYVSLKSLLMNSPIDMVFLFIEDDVFPYPVPANVRACNVSEQQFFAPGSPNFGTPWSYMELLRCCLGEMLPEMIQKVLWLDVDTIVDADISDLFDVDLTGYFYAGVLEPKKSNMFFRYINTGVLLYNLDLLRDMNKEHELISFLNNYGFSFPGQDVINLLCQGRIKVIDSEFNASAWTASCHRPKIIHYAAIKYKDYKDHWAYKKYGTVELPIDGERKDEADG